jgi:hypothetical protein
LAIALESVMERAAKVVVAGMTVGAGVASDAAAAAAQFFSAFCVL